MVFVFFYNCKRLRLRSFSKEGGGHPRRSGAGVAARRGNPGQESRNQGGRVHERVSGETSLFPASSSSCRPPARSVYLCAPPSALAILCLSLALCGSVLVVAPAPAARTTSSWLCMWVCALVITCDCAAAKCVFHQTPKTPLFTFNLVFCLVFFFYSYHIDI